MKKIASILLLGILLFNWCGYRWVINLMQQKADTKLEARLDKNDYNEAQLIEIKVPVNMPYQTDWADFERCDGSIEVNGVHYKYVKRKLQGGELILKCIPNQAKQQLELAKEDLFKLTNDIQQENGAKKSNAPAPLIKNALSEYDNLQQLTITTSYFAANQRAYNVYQQTLVTDYLHTTPEQPPEV